jgi:predicted dehydrogenase
MDGRALKNNYMNIVVWGLGKHALNKVIPAAHRSDKFSLYGVCSRDENTLEKIKKTYQIKVWSSSSEMLADQEIDAIFLATPPAVHKEQALDVLDHGKHLLCEKPITMSSEDTSLLIKKANSLNLVLLEGLMYKYHPQFDMLKSLVLSKKLGKIKEIKSSFQLPPLELPGYRRDIKLGASAIYDLGIYPVSLILGLYDLSEIDLSEKRIIYDKKLKYDISGEAILKIETDIDCVLNWSYDSTYVNEVSILGEALRLKTNFIFSKDTSHEAVISLYCEDDLIENIIINEANHFELMLKCFYYSIKDPKDKMIETDSMLDLSTFLDKLAN